MVWLGDLLDEMPIKRRWLCRLAPHVVSCFRCARSGPRNLHFGSHSTRIDPHLDGLARDDQGPGIDPQRLQLAALDRSTHSFRRAAYELRYLPRPKAVLIAKHGLKRLDFLGNPLNAILGAA